MRILFISALLPYPLASGGQIRIYNLLKRIGDKHDITLFSFIRREEECDFIEKLSFCKKVKLVYRGNAWQGRYIIRSIFGTYPFLFATYENSEMKELIQRELAEHAYDVVHIEPFYVYPSLRDLVVPFVACEHNIEYTIYEAYARRSRLIPLKPYMYFDVQKLKIWERYIWKKAAHIVTVSKADADVIGRHVKTQKISVVPNCVDTRAFRFVMKKANIDNPIFLFIGNFAWMQNKDAVSYLLTCIWPKLKNVFPNGSLRIVGMGMTKKLQRLTQAKGAHYVGFVDKIVDEYRNADILLAPIRVGGGTKYKILEAFATGLPVITTQNGADGLGVLHGRELMVAQNDNDFIQHAETLLVNNNLRKDLVLKARKKVEQEFTWEEAAKNLEKVWNRVSSIK